MGGAAVLDAWEVGPTGYASAAARPWDAAKQDIVRAVFDADFAQGGLSSADYLFMGLQNLVEVRGFEALQGAASFTQTFNGCARLETVYASAWAPEASPTGSLPFYACGRLVGGGGFVPSSLSSVSRLSLGEGGVLTDPASDARAWIGCHQYADGEPVLTAEATPEEGRELVSSGRICAQGRYCGVGYQPWYATRHSAARATLAADMATFGEVNMDYWFYGHAALLGVEGLSNLRGTREMRYAFASCTGLTELDLSGFDESALEDATYCFSGCPNLATIWADAGWELPADCSGTATFYQCTALVGGAGTTYDGGRTSAAYLRIDGGADAPGYLTARGV